MTGGDGRLGTELRALLSNVCAPSEAELDITDEARVLRFVDEAHPDLIVHLAAYTDVKGAELDRATAWRINVQGTRHLVRAAAAGGARLLHMSTDYVFSGERGSYREGDPVGPPCNYYALSKLAAEEVARVADRCLVIRTSFRPRVWPYATAFTDVYTSQDYVDVIAPLVAEVIWHASDIVDDTLHVATDRKTIYELAKRRSPGVQPATSASAGVRFPRDVSLDISRWRTLRAEWNKRALDEIASPKACD